MTDEWIRKTINQIKIGDICKRNPEWGPVLKGYCEENIRINGWTEDEEFFVSSVNTKFDYAAADRPWVTHNEVDGIDDDEFDVNNVEKHDKIHFHVGNMLWLSDASMRERKISKILP